MILAHLKNHVEVDYEVRITRFTLHALGKGSLPISHVGTLHAIYASDVFIYHVHWICYYQ